MFGNFIMTALLRQKTFLFLRSQTCRPYLISGFSCEKCSKMNILVKLLIYCEIRAFVNECANVKKHNSATYGRLTIGLSLESGGF